MVKTKKFNGIVFTFHRSYPTKSMAKIEADHKRSEGYNVRTKPYGRGFANYLH